MLVSSTLNHILSENRRKRVSGRTLTLYRLWIKSSILIDLYTTELKCSGLLKLITCPD